MDELEARTLLGVSADASPEEIKAAYRASLKHWHPDRLGADAAVTSDHAERTRELILAYRLLSEPSPPAPVVERSIREPLQESLWHQLNPLHPSHDRYSPNTVGDRVAIVAVVVVAVALLLVFAF